MNSRQKHAEGGGKLTNDKFVEIGESWIGAAEQTGGEAQRGGAAESTRGSDVRSQVEIVVLRA